MKTSLSGFHLSHDVKTVVEWTGTQVDRFDYTFENFYHPLVGELIKLVNERSVAEMLDPTTLEQLAKPFFDTDYKVNPSTNDSVLVEQPYPQKEIDVDIGGPYANYNWELFYHIPVAMGVHLSQNHRYAEAQRWFGLVFDPASTEDDPQRYWKFLYFRQHSPWQTFKLLSTPDAQLTATELKNKKSVLAGYDAGMKHPFMPHVVARMRPTAYQYYVVMAYLDNLIAWGDSLFAQFTPETVPQALLCYIQAANLLGPRPMELPPAGTSKPMSFNDLKNAQLDELGDAIVELEAQFPFDGAPAAGNGGDGSASSLFGIARTLYFCIPKNTKLLGYWDTVADRLSKIRNCMNIQGIVQPLPLFDPPVDPGMLVKAAAAGLDIGSILSGLYQPIGPLRTLPRIQKAIEICGELRSLGNSLLSAIEKQDAEQLAQLRQTHELALHQMNQNVRFLQWKQAEQATDSLLNTRATTLERYRFYLRLLGLTPDSKNAPDKLPIDRRELTEDTFDNAYAALVGEYDLPIPLETYPPLQLAQGQSPASESGAAGDGQLFLNVSEDAELNQHMPTARDTQLASSVVDTIAGILQFIPDFTADLAFWGLGASTGIFGGDKLAASLKTNAEILRTISQWEQAQGGMAARKAGYQRRADDWLLQANLAARELRQMGLQIISSLIAEQVAFQEYSVTKAQVGQAQDVLQFLQSKSTNVDFYGLMVGDLSDLYYQFYRLAIDAGRKAEQTMKWELMRPELDANTYVQPSYWESGRKGLLSGESLMLDLKRMEADYHDNNKREIDLTAHISLRQLDPLALLILKATGSCTFTVTEAYFARTIPSLYMLRIVSAAISTPSVVGPYTSINCALTLQSSTVRIKPGLRSGSNYVRDLLNQDDRFLDSFGSVDVLVTSSGTSDGGTFSPNDDRFRPFEGQGACATWHLSLPSPELPPFSYASISDVILDLQIRAREGGAELGNKAFDWLKTTLQDASNAGLGLLFSLRYDFPTEWAAADAGNKDLTFVVQKSYFPYMVQGRAISLSIGSLSLYGADAAPLASIVVDTTAMAAALNDPSNGSFKVTVPAGTFQPGADAFLIMQYGATWP